MKKVLVLYHSGSGSTKLISEVLSERLSETCEIDISQISSSFDYQQIENYDLLIFGFPTYSCQPSLSMKEFVDRMPFFQKQVKALVFTTCALYSGNTLRILIKKLDKKNVVTINYFQFIGPASDGALLFPKLSSRIFQYEKKINAKILKAVNVISKTLNSSKAKLRIPAYKWYVPLNNILLYFGELSYKKYKSRMHIIKERCINCNICVNNCPRNCWESREIIPAFDPHNCEFCLKCIHNCPQNAIIFSDKMKDNRRLNISFYNELKRNILN
ncbi:MAG: EFR1 family ferrodoxin [Candidatus Cloacimonetes bacterium]|nr:EFR1 family ferrodoxin [Candidatus Cloacimonadota bacterium]